MLVIADDGMGSRYSAAVALYVAHLSFPKITFEQDSHREAESLHD
jgi:hypothetical protein